MRCVLLSGDNEIPPQGDDVFIARYIPHSKVFPQASIIVHHGGIGTTGQALLAGKPQIVVPHFADQFDNARRLERLGVARTVIGQKYCVGRVIEAIKGVQCPRVNAKVLEAQQVVRQETGADTAARAIIKALSI
jgi:UDP:flavonoid glycosyltransferase YjiC (YdhE family)